MSERKRFMPLLLAGATAMTPAATAQPAPAASQSAQPAAPASIAPPAARPAAQTTTAAPSSASITVGLRDDFTRLSFRFPLTTTVTPILSNDRLELRFSRPADLDIAEVRASLPRFVRSLTRTSAAGQPLRLALTLDPGVRQRHFVDGDRVVVDLLAPADSPAPRQQTADGNLPLTGGASNAYAVPRGNAPVRVSEEADATRITVRWPSQARAAAFRRGEAIWILFEANGTLDLRGAQRAGRRHRDLELVNGDGVVGLRIPASPEMLVSARADGNAWVFSIGARADESADAPVRLDTQNGSRLIADFGRQGIVKAITDPEVGDTLLVALAPGPAMGVDMRRATLEAAILQSAQGAVIEPRADGVGAMFENGKLIVSRGAGLLAQPNLPPSDPSATATQLQAAFIEQSGHGNASALSNREIRDRIDALTRRAAAEGVAEGAPAEARLALARFLLECELAPETLGALRLAAINQPQIELDPEYRLMRAAANVMLHRAADARADLGASALADNPSAALWRGYAAALDENWSEARRELQRGEGALETHPPNWRARFALASAQAALELNDFDAAEQNASAAIGQATTQDIRLSARLLQARIMAARGRETQALALFDDLARARDEEVAVRAQLEAVKLRRSLGQMQLADAADRLEALRYRWRGDELEVDTVSALGAIYSEMQRWREALATMRIAADRYPNEPAARRLQSDMQTIFTRLFLEGEADKLEPIQALGLFYEFTDLTPIGPSGDRIVRSLAGRLVAVDLLEQSETLLQHQVDERLEGVGKAQVAGELAAIYLMDRKPEQALIVINSSRQPNMPAALVAERRIIEARAHLDLGRLDHAVELVERDTGPDAQRIRAEAAWRARDWERAAAELRGVLRARNRAQPLDADGRQVVLRAAIALTLAQNEEGVRALYREYAGDVAGTPDADSFEVVASGIQAQGSSVREVARAVARTDLLDRFLTNIRTRMTDAAPGAPQRPAAPATAAVAPPANPQQPQRPAAAASPSA
ncbi:MAG: hypothetical protein ABW199_07110 [Caulobacterales bacterium]